MRVIAKSALEAFWPTLPKGEQASARAALYSWYEVTRDADWSNYSDIKATFNTADWVGDAKVVFDVGGNKYRIVCVVGFKSKRLFVIFVGTHKQYDAVDVTAI